MFYVNVVHKYDFTNWLYFEHKKYMFYLVYAICMDCDILTSYFIANAKETELGCDLPVRYVI